jgi:hypothetical protein
MTPTILRMWINEQQQKNKVFNIIEKKNIAKKKM